MSDNKNNTGNWNTGDWNTGNWNTGDRNTGVWNSGNWNTGNLNTGDRNTGVWNSGDWNTGNCNSGNHNTGNWNSTNNSSGYFNSKTEKTIKVFNKDCDIDEWENSEKPDFIFFEISFWINEDKMTTEEKEENPSYEKTGGYLKKLSYKEAFQKSYNDLSEEERAKQTELLKALPNFDEDVFYEISGIRIESSGSADGNGFQ